MNASDASGIDHFWINDTQRFTISDNGVIASHSIFCWIPAVGVYRLEVRAYDPYNNYCNATFKLNVQDTSPPTWGVQPQNQILEYGEELNLTLWVFEMSQVSWMINDTTHFSLYVYEGNITVQITSINALESGKYGLNISVIDIYGNAMWANITITALPSTSPLDFNSIFLITIQVAGIGGLVAIAFIIIFFLRRRRKKSTD